MSLPVITGKHVAFGYRLIFGGYNIEGLSQVSLPLDIAAVDVTEFGQIDHTYAPGLGDGKVDGEFFVKYGTYGNEVQFAAALRTIKDVTLSPRGQIGDKCYFLEAFNSKFQLGGSDGNAEKVPFSLTPAAGKRIIPGTVLEDGLTSYVLTARTASGTSAPQNVGAVPSGMKLYAVLHVYQVPEQITPAIISVDTNNWAPVDAVTAHGLSYAYQVNQDVTADKNITGLAGGFAGKIVKIHNISSHNIVLKDLSGSSTSSKQFDLGGDHTIAAGATYQIAYNSGTSKWNPDATTFPTLIVKLQSDALVGFGSPTDIWTSETYGVAVGSERHETAGPITDTWFRMSWAIVGGGPYNFHASVGIL